MNKQEFTNLVKAVRTAYPNFQMISTPEGLNMWYAMLSDIPLPDLNMAFQKHIATSKYPPSIAEIRELASQGQEAIKDWSEGYGLLKRAIKNFGYYREKEAIEWLTEEDPLTANIVQRLGYQTFCLSEDEMTDRANFRMAYTNEQKISNQQKQLPRRLRNNQLEANRERLDGMLKAIG